MDPLKAASASAYSGLAAQSMRMRITAENISNAESTGSTAGADPYRRKTVSFAQELDSLSGANVVRVSEVGVDPSPFVVEYQPGHPAADDKGNVKMPNVNMIVEMTDMRMAARSYEANLQVIRQGREMSASLVDLLRST
ncbi:MAG: flagellar basal body rod protein FlgC [Proteobacteria bacterium]|nr:flagellar basal body rod protein FlgC [Pseudomonadota bacterium]